MISTSNWLAHAESPLRGTIRVPGDKSISHRAMMLGALADGVTRVSGFLEGEDTLATAAAFRAMGVRIEEDGPGRRIVHGVGIDGLKAPAAPIDCGNAGTGMRLLAGILAGQSFDSVLIGDASLTRRPMRRVTEPLASMGARIQTAEGGTPPLRVSGGQSLVGTRHELSVASAQVKSALLLAGLYARGTTTVREPHPTRDYTERMLAALGWPVEFSPGFAQLSGDHRLRACDIAVPSDFSSAAFFLVAASIVPGSDLVLEAVGMNPRRTGLLEALRRMGARIEVRNAREEGGEPVADLHVVHAPLQGAEIPEAIVPDMIDEFPVLFVAASAASGVTVVRGAAELRVKESDRIAVMARGLRDMGARIEETPDGAVIHGGAPLGAAEVEAHDDHRIAMSFVVAGQRSNAPVAVRGCATVATSFPGFFDLARTAGIGLSRM